LLKNVLDLFTSTRVVLTLFALLVCFLVPLTIFNEFRPILIKPVKIILALICANLMACTLSRLKSLRRSTLVIHLGSIIVLTGSQISTLGFVATVNIYEGSTIDTVFNWDVKQDVPLGYDLRVDKISMSLYPVGIKVGVLKNGLFEEYRIQVLRLDPLTKVLYLSVESLEGKVIGTMSTKGQKNLPPDFPLDFKLVAFQDPQVKRMWVDLKLLKNGKTIVSGASEVNHPLRWQGMKFFLTQITADDMGRPYAGIQISKDPGVPYVYGGFAVLFLGLLLALKRWKAASVTSTLN
jgi:hypothetical protein